MEQESKRPVGVILIIVYFMIGFLLSIVLHIDALNHDLRAQFYASTISGVICAILCVGVFKMKEAARLAVMVFATITFALYCFTLTGEVVAVINYPNIAELYIMAGTTLTVILINCVMFAYLHKPEVRVLFS